MLFLLNLCLMMGVIRGYNLFAMAQLLMPDLNANSISKVQDDLQNITRYAADKNSSMLELEDILSRRQHNPFAFLDPIDLSDPNNLVTPNGPMLRCNWDPVYWCYKAQARLAFEMALELASTAVGYMLDHGANGPSYQRYFDTESQHVVFEIFMAMFNSDPATHNQPGYVASPVFQNLDFRYDVPYGYKDWATKHCNDRLNTAFIYQGPAMGNVYTPTARGLVVFCPTAFTVTELPRDVHYPYECSRLFVTPYAQASMHSLSYIVLHEMMHYTEMHKGIRELVGTEIADYKASKDDDNDPPNGYGPYNAMRLKVRGRKPILNADSYAWFALEVWWAKKCDMVFNDPPDPANPPPWNPDDYILPEDTTHG